MLKDATWQKPLMLDERTDYMLPNPALVNKAVPAK